MRTRWKFKLFWLVWSPQGKAPPTRRHYDKQVAIQEAMRLSRENPGSEFHVLESVGCAEKTDVTWTAPEDSNNIPF